MKDKYYGLTNKPTSGAEDKAPDWMNSLFDKKDYAKKIAGNPLAGASDPILNPNAKPQVKKCRVCGAPLSAREVGVCANCK
jgi:hypothetical protein